MPSSTITLEGLRKIYEYIRDKDMKGGSGLQVDFNKEDQCIHFSLETTAVNFATDVMVPEIRKFMNVPVDVTPIDSNNLMGVCLVLKTNKDELIDIIAKKSNLETIRVALSPEFGFSIAKGIAEYLIYLKEG